MLSNILRELKRSRVNSSKNVTQIIVVMPLSLFASFSLYGLLLVMLIITGFTGPVMGPERETSVEHTVPALPDLSRRAAQAAPSGTVSLTRLPCHPFQRQFIMFPASFLSDIRFSFWLHPDLFAARSTEDNPRFPASSWA